MPDSKAKRDWQREHRTVITLSVMNDTEKDILDRLNGQPNKSGYIKRLIREDIEEGK